MVIRPRIGFTYDCDQCKQPVSGSFELFALRDKSFFHHCSCGHGGFSIKSESGQLFLEFSCSLCGKKHSAVLPALQALDGVNKLTCPEYALPACFVGAPELIEYMDSDAAEQELTELIRSLLSDPL